jgi:hypothetical protein
MSESSTYPLRLPRSTVFIERKARSTWARLL